MEQSNRCQNCEVSFDEPAILPEGVAANSPPKPLTIRKYVQNRVSQLQIYLIFAIALVGIGIATQYHAKTEIMLVGGIVIAVVSILVGRTVAASTRCQLLDAARTHRREPDDKKARRQLPRLRGQIRRADAEEGGIAQSGIESAPTPPRATPPHTPGHVSGVRQTCEDDVAFTRQLPTRTFRFRP